MAVVLETDDVSHVIEYKSLDDTLEPRWLQRRVFVEELSSEAQSEMFVAKI